MPLVSSIIPFPFWTARSLKGASDRLTPPRVLLGLVLIGTGLGLGAAPVQAQERPVPDTTVADTVRRPPPADSGATGEPVPADSQGLSPTTVSVDTGLIRRYVPTRRKRSMELYEHISPFVGPRPAASSEWSATLDSTQNDYVLTGDERFGDRMRLGAEVYRRERYRANLRDNWRALVERRQQQEENRGGVGVNMVVPGGRESAFSTVFGKPQVDLRLNGQADINAGFDYRKSDQQANITGDATQISPNFKQDLRLGITGTIGDKLKINVDWDTDSQFNYQNQVKLNYTGYEDEILQNVEAGNVSMQTPSQLISGGQSLFGIKGEFQLGNLSLTTIASQQEGQSNSLSIEGGSQKTEFDLKPTGYDENRHFFLGYFFRNNWNRAHEDPTTIRTFEGFDKITKIEVWKTTRESQNNTNARQALAVVDLGESAQLLERADGYDVKTQLPASSQDQYTADNIEKLRDGNTRASTYLGPGGGVDHPLNTQHDVHVGKFERLTRGQDYRVDARLGFLSLQQRLQSDEALAVAFRYRTSDGTVRTVGDFSGDRGGSSGGINADRIVLKLLRPDDPVAPSPDGSVDPAAWYLQMRNIYSLSGRDFTPETFELNVEYQASGSGAQTTIPEVGGQRTLLQILGLDRVDQNGAPNPDNQFDFLPQTIDTGEGLIYFPYLQPFGERILDAAEENGDRSAGEAFAFKNLYTKKKTNAKKEDPQKNVYHLRGTFSGGSKQFYDLKAFTGLVKGSVEVTAGGQTLQEGVDYRVDYQGGTVNILNESYLTAGRKINISYEQNSIANLQKKTLLGARADWSLQDKFSLGATVMRLSQQSPVDKFRIGQEPIKNTIWGINGSMNLEPRWLTQAVDALPLVQTRAKSKLTLSGEFAQLRPGHTTTDAFQRTVDQVKDSETDSYAPDELSGVSYIDDFEGFENAFSLREQPGSWQISAAPDSTANASGLDGNVPGYEDNRARTHWRGSLAWYRLSENIMDKLSGSFTRKGNPEASSLIDTKEVFVGRDTRGEANPILRTFDLYFDPWERGAYNYTKSLENFFRNPKKVWGGITRSLPEGYNDFSVQNVEFVEFIVKVYPQNGTITEGAHLFVNLGTISEDVVPNRRIDREDGLSLNFNEEDLGERSRIPNAEPGNGIKLQGKRTQDLGLDGLVSYTEGPYDERLFEKNFYAPFVEEAEQLQGQIGQLGLTGAQQQRLRAEIARIKEDPSADNYHYYENDRYFNEERFFPGDVTLQQRFSRYFAGHELNGFESQNKLAKNVTVRRGVSRAPDRESLEGGSSSNVNINDNYFQYAIPLDKLNQRAQTNLGPTDYVVSKVGKEKDWYKIRIPVKSFTRQVGNIQNFDNIKSIRLWTTGHTAPVTMRFASLELVGSQWRASEAVAKQPVEQNEVMEKGPGKIRVASINNEEDPSYEPPVGAVVGQSRTAQGVQQRKREQALLMNVDQLEPDQQRAVFKTFGQGLDLLKYSNLRMYTHLHGTSSSSQEKEELRKNLRLFVRFGASETGDYYEYEQKLKPGDIPSASGSQDLWPEKYEMNLVIERLNRLKLLRGQTNFPTDSTFSSGRDDVNLDLGFAPPGAKLKIRGTPSLQNVQTIVVGVRHKGRTDDVLSNFKVWVNELRVSGFDEQNGWAANANATIKLADFASVQGSFQRRTDGFGGLSSTLNERERSNSTSWNVRTELKLGSLLPERQGWSIPVTMQVQSSHTVPRFDPNRGDVEVRTLAKQFDAVPTDTLAERYSDRYGALSGEAIRARLKDSVRTAAETRNMRSSVTANVSKQDSDSWWMQKTIDAMSLNLSYLNRSARNPQNRFSDEWGWSGNFEYRLNFGQPKTVNPFGFLPDLPVLGTLSNLSFNYVPRSVSFTASSERNVKARRSRPSGNGGSQLPPRLAFKLRQQERFNHQRNFSLQYDPFEFLSLSFDTNTRQSFKDAASQTRTNVLIRSNRLENRVITDIGIDPDSTQQFFDNLSEYDLKGSGLTPDSVGSAVFFENRLTHRSELDVFRRLLMGGANPRTNNYRQRFSATLSMGWTDRESLNWIDLQDVNYESSFQWQNGSKGSLTGAGVQNELSLRTGMNFHPNKVWERFGFFRRLKKAQRQSGQDEGQTRQGGEAPSEGEGTEEKGEETSTEDDGVGWEDVPLPDPMGMLRGLALMALDINDASVSYQGSWSSRSSNVGNLNASTTNVRVHHSLLDAVRGNGPAVGYRFGLKRSIDSDERVLEDSLEFQVSDALSNRHRFEGRTTLSPSQSFQVDLSWNMELRGQEDVTLQAPTEEGGPVQRFPTESGEGSVSVWGFGSFTSMFEAQVNRLQKNTSVEGDTISARATALSNSSVAKDFRGAFLTDFGNVGTKNFVPLPMPGWNVRYTGLANWPLVKRVVKSATLSHSYNAKYKSSFSSETASDSILTVNVSGATQKYVRPQFEIGSSSVNEQFQPLLGLDITWPGNLKTSLEWNLQETTFLRTASLKVEKVEKSELSGSISYRKRGLRIPFFGLGRLENQIRFSLTLSRTVNDERTYNLQGALRAAQSSDQSVDPLDPKNDYVVVRKQTTRLKVAPELTYRLSDRVSADLMLEYEQFNGDNRRPSYTQINGGFNVRVNITQN